MLVHRQGEDAAPTRVMVFAPTSEAATACAPPIRNVLWGAHKVAVLLPKGEEPIKVCRPYHCLRICFVGVSLNAQQSCQSSCPAAQQQTGELCRHTSSAQTENFTGRHQVGCCPFYQVAMISLVLQKHRLN